MPERILVVGHAAVTCLGRDMDSTWQGLVDGRSGIRRHASLGSDLFLQDVGGIIDNFGPGSAAEDPSVAKLGARFLHFSMAAARTAWADAGLDRLAPDEMREFAALNDAYRARFGFPFIMAVKGKSKADIVAAFQRRLANDADAETRTALAEIDRIAVLRLKDILP